MSNQSERGETRGGVWRDGFERRLELGEDDVEVI